MGAPAAEAGSAGHRPAESGVLEQAVPRGSGSRILAVANQKGGVGKTTSVINLGAALAISGKRVLLMDMDPQANATSALGIQPMEGKATIYDVLLGDVRLLEAVVETETDNLKLIPSSPHFAGAEVELVAMDRREYLLRDQLEPLRHQFDYVFLDCPPSLGLLTVNALAAADGVIVPIQCEYLALEGLSHLLETLQAIRKNLNPRLRVEGLLLTMYDGRLTLSQQVAGEARAYFGSRVYRTMIPRNVRLGEAPSFGKPVVTYDRSCAGSLSYMNLAKEILDNESQGIGPWSEGSHSGDAD
ncbi:MAG: AAA family ATPase [Candidatus Eisenbacteria bacterium]|nr:AAA family ATPase [Candidatus Eisenbacteria bacterium]